MSISPVNRKYVENISHCRAEDLPLVDAYAFYEALDSEFEMSKAGESLASLAYQKLYIETNRTCPGIGIESLKSRLIEANSRACELRIDCGTELPPDRSDYKISGEDQVKIYDYVKHFVQQYKE
ncbi:MAG: hypothetical protein NTX49_03110 [Chlamydiae bacterium]|nr:hypothetical protein [Chlamydiota bacterium]